MIFISPNEDQKLYFHEWRSQPLVTIQLLVFMSEIIINITPKKNQIFCFFYAKMWRKLTFSDRQPSLQKTNFFQVITRVSFMVFNVFTSSLILSVNVACTWKIALNVNLINGCKERSDVCLVRLVLCALITLRWRYK